MFRLVHSSISIKSWHEYNSGFRIMRNFVSLFDIRKFFWRENLR